MSEPSRPTVPFTIDPDIRRAWTLPSEVYRSEAWFAAERERVFAGAWHWVGNAEEPSRLRHARPFTLLPGVLDEPLVLTCDDAGAVRCLSNVCTHRGTILVEEECEVSGFRCRYHGRRFALDGRFVSMPQFEDAEDFPSRSDDLASLPLEKLGPLLFASLGPDVQFDEWIAPVRERLAFLSWDHLVFDAAASRDYEVGANWALYCDNYLEGFHIPFVHAGLNEALEWTAYETHLFPHGTLQIGIAKEGEPAFILPRTHPDFGKRVAAYYFWLFPNAMLNFYPWGLSLNVVEPRGVDSTRVRFLFYVADRSMRDRGAGADLHGVEMEDEAVVEAVQRGVRSRLYHRGRYSPPQERGVHHFHRLLAAVLAKGIA